jgi:hypothetical protein
MKNSMRLLFFLILAAPVAFAQQNNDDLFKSVDLTTPESPAFVALGVSPQEVHRPSTREMFGASILNAVDNSGKLQSGFAFEATPYLVFRGYLLTRGDFNASRSKQILSRTSISFATTKAADADPTQRAALGAYMKLIDVGDPRLDPILHKCVLDHLPLPPPKNPFPTRTGNTVQADETSDTQIIPAKDENIDKCFADSTKRRANRSSWVVAVSPVWVTATGDANDLSNDGGAVWTSLAYGFDRFRLIHTPDDLATPDIREDLPQSWLAQNGQIIVHARWRDNERVKEKDGTVVEHDSRFFGARFRASGKRTAGSIELSHIVDDTSAKSVTKRRMLIGFEQQLSEGLWLQLSFGRDFGGRDGGKPIIARSSFRWAFNDKKQ